MKRYWMALGAVVLTLAMAGNASADLVTFDFTCSSGCLEDDGSDGNSLSFTQDGLTVTVRAYNSIVAGGIYQSAEVTQYGNGLGVEAAGVDTSDSTDNFANEDLLLFEFTAAGSSAFVDPESVSLYASSWFFGDLDTDANIILGVGSPGLSIAGYAGIDILLNTSPFDYIDPLDSPYDGPIGGSPTVHTIDTTLQGNYLAVLARPLHFDDAFWIGGLTVEWAGGNDTQTPGGGVVPEPTTMVLLSMGVGAVAIRKRFIG